MRHGPDPHAAQAPTRPAAGVRARKPAPTELSVAGTPSQARAAIDARHAAGATGVVLVPAGPDALASLDSLARALDPRL
ncbi:hypothetical protein ABZX39_31010 [Streptomyces collinus]|uniref:hypothetical protein n=1 Tax=Streptomyces collinus TaxID=42684 RepID=UPI0033B2FE7B